MSPMLQFVDRLIHTGEAVFQQKPIFAPEERPELLELLARAHARYRLDVAGPLLPLDGEAALGALRFVTFACWALVGEDPADTIKKNLQFSLCPAGPEAHLSADLTLRYLPTVHRRVRTRVPDDPLRRAVVDVLRRWPLSGALADIDAAPEGELNFGNHFGLQLLYAERLTACFRDAWIPQDGRGREAIELALQQQENSDKMLRVAAIEKMRTLRE